MIKLIDVFILLMALYLNESEQTGNFKILLGKSISNLTKLKQVINVKDKQFCLNECERLEICSIAAYFNQTCILMTGYLNISNQNAFDIASSYSFLFIKQTTYYSNSFYAFLCHWWPFDNNYNDIISGANLDSQSVGFIVDRLNRPSSALFYTNNEFMNLTPIYSTENSTVTAWVNLQSYSKFASQYGSLIRNTLLKLNTWQHLAFIQDLSTLTIFVDGIMIYQSDKTQQNKFVSNFWPNFFQTAFIDDLMIFKKCLSQPEIIKVMSSYL